MLKYKFNILKTFSVFFLTLTVLFTLFNNKVNAINLTNQLEFSNFSPAIYNPPPTANFLTPENGISSIDQKINISFDLKANNEALINKNVYVQLFVLNSPSTTNTDAYIELLDTYQIVNFSNKDEIKSLSFNNIPLLYQGDNYIFCYLQTDSGSDFCGGFYESDYLNIKYTGKKAPLYRFYSNSYKGHFFTTDHYEKKKVIKDYNDQIWNYEGIAYYVSSIDGAKNCQESGTNQVHRFWNAGAKHHFYTIDSFEKDHIITNDKAWTYEGVAFCAKTSQNNDTTPIFRFYNKGNTTHFYTSSEYEKDSIIKNDPAWSFEGIAYYAYK